MTATVARAIRRGADPTGPARATGHTGGQRKDRVSPRAWLLVAPLVAFALPTLLLLLIATAPTLAATLADRRPRRYAAYCVGGFNIAASLPYLVRLWTVDNTIAGVGGFVHDAGAWLVVYGAAAFGWALIWGAPRLSMAIALRQNRRKLAALRRERDHMNKAWGDVF